jgi:D-lactate dehydrogenase (cytochrome)
MQPDDWLSELKQRVGPDRVVDQPDALLPFSTDWIEVERGKPDLAVLPTDTAGVADAIRLAGGAGLAIVARGAGTGLAGGARPRFGGAVVATDNLKRILEVDIANRRVLVEPGLINWDLSAALKERGYFYAPDPASWKICSIGGNIANNSGGPRCMKYGVTSNHVLALEVVLHDGRVFWTGDGITEAFGYDLNGLIVGSEGTFGIVTRALLRLTRLPEANRVALALFPDVVAACASVSAILAAGHVPTALEVMDGTTMLAVNRAHGYGLPEEAGAALIVEVDGVEDGLDSMMAEIVGICEQRGAISVSAAADAAAQEQLWSARRSAFDSFHTLAPAYHLVDTVVPRTRLPQMMAHVQQLSRDYAMPIANVFHAGDGNLHPLVLYDPADPQQVEKAHAITARVLELSIDEGGTVSGEHGIGLEKQDFLARVYSPTELEAQAAVYAVFNPQNRLNPGKVFPNGSDPLELAARHAERLKAPATLQEWEALLAELEQIVGGAQLLVAADAAGYAIQGRAPACAVLPASLDELAAVMAACHRAAVSVVPWGGGSQQQRGRLSQAPEVVVVTSRLNQVLHYEPDDLTIGVGAGMRLAELQALLADHQQSLPLDAPQAGQTTLGGLVATAADGPQRAGYGTLRDMLLGLTLVEADGTIVKLGGQVVKNVSGYDMVKLLLGSHGTLGIIAEVRLRTYPRPPAETTLLIGFNNRATALALVDDIAVSRLRPVTQELFDSASSRRTGLSPIGAWGLALRLSGTAQAVERQVQDLEQMARRRGAASMLRLEARLAPHLWEQISDLSAAQADAGAALLRIAVPPAELGRALEDLEQSAAKHGLVLSSSVRAFNGLVFAYVSGDTEAIGAFQAGLVERWKHSQVLAGDLPAEQEHLRWGAPPTPIALELMQQIKAAFDPQGRLNPGRMGIL